MQQIDPAGVGARDLQECLRLQLENFDTRENETAAAKATARLTLKILDKYWEPMARHSYEDIARKLRRPVKRFRTWPTLSATASLSYTGAAISPVMAVAGRRPTRPRAPRRRNQKAGNVRRQQAYDHLRGFGAGIAQFRFARERRLSPTLGFDATRTRRLLVQRPANAFSNI